MATSHPLSTVCDCYSSVLQFVKSLLDGIHCNSFSKHGRLQTVEVKCFLEAAVMQELKPLVIGFATNLLRLVKLCLKTTYATELRCREQSSVAFYQAQQGPIPVLWNKVYCDMSLPIPDPLWTQTVSRPLFEDILMAKLKNKHPPIVPVTEEHHKFEADQENVLLYMAGSVPFKLLNKYKKRDTEEAAAVVDCLSEMAIAGEDSSLLAYTSEWTKAINRGGLFEVGDATYLFFQTMEAQVKVLLQAHVPGVTVPEAELVKSVCSNEDVLFH